MMDTEMHERDALAEKLVTALQMQRRGIAMMRQSLARRRPDQSADDIDARLSQLLLNRPEAEHGDGIGSLITL